MLMWHQHQPLVSLPRKLERFQPDWNKTRPRPSLIVSCYPWISTPEGWLGVSSQDENALAVRSVDSRHLTRRAFRYSIDNKLTVPIKSISKLTCLGLLTDASCDTIYHCEK